MIRRGGAPVGEKAMSMTAPTWSLWMSLAVLSLRMSKVYRLWSSFATTKFIGSCPHTHTPGASAYRDPQRGCRLKSSLLLQWKVG